MNRTKKPFIYRRIFAYVIDIFLVAMTASLITMFFPSNEVYEEKMSELSTVMSEYRENKITETEYLALYDDISYELTKSSVDSTIVIIAISLLYFVVFNYYNNGVTLGKRLMKIKIVSANGKELRLNHYLIRSLIINSVIANLVSVILIEFLSKENYMLYNSKISIVFSIIYGLCFIFILYRNDGRGLHDLVSNTKIVSSVEDKVEDNEKIEVKQEESTVVEAEYKEKKPKTVKESKEKKEKKAK